MSDDGYRDALPHERPPNGWNPGGVLTGAGIAEVRPGAEHWRAGETYRAVVLSIETQAGSFVVPLDETDIETINDLATVLRRGDA